MTGCELQVIDEYLIEMFQTDVTLVSLLASPAQIFVDAAPPKTIPPYIIISVQSVIDRSVIGGVRIVVRPLYWIKAVTQSKTYTTASAIAKRVDELLQESSGTNDGLTISCEGREQPVRTYEIDQGLRWNYVGGLYRFFVS